MRDVGITRWRANPCRRPDGLPCWGEYVDGLLDAWARLFPEAGGDLISRYCSPRRS
jgi:hypothetical protein